MYDWFCSRKNLPFVMNVVLFHLSISMLIFDSNFMFLKVLQHTFFFTLRAEILVFRIVHFRVSLRRQSLWKKLFAWEQLLNKNMGWKIIGPILFFFWPKQKFWFFECIAKSYRSEYRRKHVQKSKMWGWNVITAHVKRLGMSQLYFWKRPWTTLVGLKYSAKKKKKTKNKSIPSKEVFITFVTHFNIFLKRPILLILGDNRSSLGFTILFLKVVTYC